MNTRKVQEVQRSTRRVNAGVLGATSDGYDMVAPFGRREAVRCMKMASSTAKNKIDYINTHGTSTPVGDITEQKAVGEAFKD